MTTWPAPEVVEHAAYELYLSEYRMGVAMNLPSWEMLTEPQRGAFRGRVRMIFSFAAHDVAAREEAAYARGRAEAEAGDLFMDGRRAGYRAAGKTEPTGLYMAGLIEGRKERDDEVSELHAEMKKVHHVLGTTAVELLEANAEIDRLHIEAHYASADDIDAAARNE